MGRRLTSRQGRFLPVGHTGRRVGPSGPEADLCYIASQHFHGGGGDSGDSYGERSGGFSDSGGISGGGGIGVGIAGAAGTIVCTGGGVVAAGIGIFPHTSQSGPNWRRKRSEKQRKKTGIGSTITVPM